MLVVSCRLLACRRLISSWMLTSESEVTCFSSSIFASSSAMGCSKSRKATAMYGLPASKQAGARGYGRGAQGANGREHEAKDPGTGAKDSRTEAENHASGD